MQVNITNSDIELCTSRKKCFYMKIILLNAEYTEIDELQGECMSGSVSVDASADIRRTCSLELYSRDSSYDVAEYNKIWLNRRVKVRIGFTDGDTTDIVWYDMGIFTFDSCSYSYALDAKSISIQCSDLIGTINGTHGGMMDGQQFLIEKGHDLKKVIIDILDNHTDIKEYNIGTIGEYGCLRDKYANWKRNRLDSGSSQTIVDKQERDGVDYLYDNKELDTFIIETSSGSDISASESGEQVIAGVEVGDYIDMGTWHRVPYDLEFGIGTSVFDVIKEIRDLYPNYESYFDVNGMFIMDMIPSRQLESNLLDYQDIAPLVISETYDVDLTTVRNATRIYGKSIETDRYAEADAVKISNHLSNGKVDGYVFEVDLDHYETNNKIKVGFCVPEFDTTEYDTTLPTYIKLKETHTSVTVYGEEVTTYSYVTFPITQRNTIVKEDAEDNNIVKNDYAYDPLQMSIFEAGGSYCFQYIKTYDTFVYLGMYQVEAYYEETSADSPFSIDKIGLRLQVLSGDDYDNITDLALCEQRAEYENWKACRLNDAVTLNTVLIPFLDVNQKVQYKSNCNDSINEYLIQSINFSLFDSTCDINMSKFYNLYPMNDTDLFI